MQRNILIRKEVNRKMPKIKTEKIFLDKFGSYLGMGKGCYIVRDKKKQKVKSYPAFEREIGEVILKTGNTVSVGALSSFAFWETDVLILTRKGKPIATLRALNYDNHVKTRIAQYQTYLNERRVYIAKQFVLGKMKGQTKLLRKYDLKPRAIPFKKIESISDNNNHLAIRKLMAIEGTFSKDYFKRIFPLFHKSIRPKSRKTFRAYDGLNNIFNLCYEILKWKIHIAIVKAKLEPYLGFLHTCVYERPSLICDFQELYRHLIDDFIIQNCGNLKAKDFKMKWQTLSRKTKGKREYLNDLSTNQLIEKLYEYFMSKIDVPRIRRGKKQELETLINEEAILLAMFLRHERETWIPRVADLLT